MKFHVAAISALAILTTPSPALTLILDYSHDLATDNFFGSNPVAKASLEAARNDIQSAITSQLAAISNDTYSASSGGASVTYNLSLGYTNPSTGAAETTALSTMAADQVKIYVGMRELSGSTLGQGGSGGAGLSLGGGGAESGWVATINAANALASAERLRGTGPVMSTLSGVSTFGSTPGNISISLGSTLGNLWFDNDTDNNGLTDGSPTLEANWHFDHTTPVASGKSDFYTVALHEMLHSIGLGASVSWNANVSGTNWLGSEVITLLGSGTNVVDGGGAHIASGILTPRLSDGVNQEAVMSPSLLVGSRKTLTQLDLAFLRDINWQTVPEPGSAAFTMLVLAGLMARRKRE